MSSPHSTAPRRRPPHGPHGPRFSKEKAKDFKGTMRRVLGLLAPHKLALLAILVFAVGGTVFNIVGPKVLSTATTEVFEGALAAVQGTGGIDFDAVARILLATLSLYLLSTLCSFVQSWLMTGMVQRLCYKLREDINLKIDRMPFGYFERNSTGDTLSRITNDVDTMGQTLAQSVVQLVTGITTVAGVLVMMLLISPLMTLVALLIIPVSLALVMLIVKRS